MTDDERRLVIALHAKRCPDEHCELVHFATGYLDEARELLRTCAERNEHVLSWPSGHCSVCGKDLDHARGGYIG